MNEKLKFTFGHICAFIALVFISYITFMGITYWSDGNFLWAAIGVVVIDLILFFLMMKTQRLKAIDRHFDKAIKVERFLLITFIICSMVAFIPFSHFWTVFNVKNELVGDFRYSVNESKKIFEEYENYSNNRIKNYKTDLERVVKSKNNSPSQYIDYGFSNSYSDSLQVSNFEEHLKQILLSENYVRLDSTANNWISKADAGASVWNVFLLGNIKEIEKSVNSWGSSLEEMSATFCPKEDASKFGYSISFKKFNDIYTKWEKPTIFSIVIGIVSYLMLLLPYFLQLRHTRSTYTLLSKKETYNKNSDDDIFVIED